MKFQLGQVKMTVISGRRSKSPKMTVTSDVKDAKKHGNL